MMTSYDQGDEFDRLMSSVGKAEPSAEMRKGAAGVVEIYTALVDAGMPESVAKEIVVSMVTATLQAKYNGGF